MNSINILGNVLPNVLTIKYRCQFFDLNLNTIKEFYITVEVSLYNFNNDYRYLKGSGYSFGKFKPYSE